MKVALIPPIALLEDTHKTNIQLVLPQNMREPAYRDMYSGHLANADQYCIMDNGAAEKELVSARDLFELASFFLPDELAIPDIIGDTGRTVEMAKVFCRTYASPLKRLGVRLGYVTQGKDIEEALSGVQEIVEAWGSHIDVLYIPRHLVRRHNKSARIRLANDIRATWPKGQFDIHFFGASHWWPGEVLAIKRYAPFVRSIDTSLPYNYAYAGRALKAEAPPVSRAQGYFHHGKSAFEGAEKNVERYLAWAM